MFSFSVPLKYFRLKFYSINCVNKDDQQLSMGSRCAISSMCYAKGKLFFREIMFKLHFSIFLTWNRIPQERVRGKLRCFLVRKISFENLFTLRFFRQLKRITRYICFNYEPFLFVRVICHPRRHIQHKSLNIYMLSEPVPFTYYYNSYNVLTCTNLTNFT